MALARLIATVAAPLDPTAADVPRVLHWPGRRVLVQRDDAVVVTLDIQEPDEGAPVEVRFPAPWPRRFGSVTVSPNQDAAVFAGAHAVRSVNADGTVGWEIKHGCWCETCSLTHQTVDEYLHDPEHSHFMSGSAAFGSHGSLVWAHVPGPLEGESDTAADQELWVALDARSGEVLGHAETETVSSTSEHTSHPDPAQMGLSVGEGEEGSPALWGRWDGRELTVSQIDVEQILLDVSPSGLHLLGADIGQWSLTLYNTEDLAPTWELDAVGTVPDHPMNTRGGRVFWDSAGAFVSEDVIIAGTSESDAPHGAARHWVVDGRKPAILGEFVYPFPVTGPVRSAGSGAWYTVSQDGTSVHLWQLAEQ